MDKARKAAVSALVRLHKGGWANLAVKKPFAPLSATDRGFAAAVYYGTAERLVTLDYLLKPFLKKPVEKLDMEVRAILESGLYQIRYMNVPTHAAVNEAVKLTRVFGKSSAAGLVNAVLRGASSVVVDEEAFSTPVRWSVSEAVARAVKTALPEEYDDFFAASFGGREICLRVNPLKISTQGLLAALGDGARPGKLPNSVYATLSASVEEEPYFKEGYYHVQGEASQYACACVEAKPGMRVLDLCAAPGGKGATLAEELGGGAGLTLCELHEKRLNLAENLFKRLGLENAEFIVCDASSEDFAIEGQDAVLCDVPCSGLGVLGKKPDLRYGTGENYAALPALQGAILRSGARCVKRGGRLVYSTCTIREEENADVVRAFLEENKNFRLLSPPFSPAASVIKDDMMTIYPHKTGLDGFFVACMESL